MSLCPAPSFRPFAAHTGSVNDATGTLFFTYDKQFNVTGVWTEDQEAVERYGYAAYGERTVLNADLTKKTVNASTVDQQRGHQGLPLDRESGAYYNRARQLLPGVGVFNGRDPKGYVDGNHLYQNVRSNPNQFTDPSGLVAYKLGNDAPTNPYDVFEAESKATYNTQTYSSYLQLVSIRARLNATVNGGITRGLFGGGYLLAASMLDHFYSNTGSEYKLDFGSMIESDESSRIAVESNIAYAQIFVDTNISAAQVAREADQSVDFVSTDTEEVTAGDGWHMSVGTYRIWESGTVTMESNSCDLSMKLTTHLVDFYDWELGSEKVGGFVTDGEMALMHRWGEGREFKVTGEFAWSGKRNFGKWDSYKIGQ